MFKDFTEGVINACSYVLTATMTKEVFQIISLVVSIIGTLVIIFCKVYDWYTRAKEDGKITKEEIKELGDSVKPDLDKLKEQADEIVEISDAQHNADKEE